MRKVETVTENQNRKVKAIMNIMRDFMRWSQKS